MRVGERETPHPPPPPSPLCDQWGPPGILTNALNANIQSRSGYWSGYEQYAIEARDGLYR